MRRFLPVLIVGAFSFGAAFAADSAAGQAAYEKSCKSCHGADGTANPAIAKMLKADIPDFKSAEVQGLSADDVKKIVAEGKGKMKPIKNVTPDAVDNIVAYIKTLKK